MFELCISPWRQSEGRFKHPRKVRLIGEASLNGHVDQRLIAVNLLTGKIESAHQQIAVGAGAESEFKLTRQFIAR